MNGKIDLYKHIEEEIDKLLTMYKANATKDNEEFMRGFTSACDSIKVMLVTESLMETVKECAKIVAESPKKEEHS